MRFLLLIVLFLLAIPLIVGIVMLVVLLTRKKKHNPQNQQPPQVNHPVPPPSVAQKPLSEVLKEHRLRCGMTQEFVAERLDVSRQAVSKWESGTSDPSTANLLALAKLYGLSADELLREAQT